MHRRADDLQRFLGPLRFQYHLVDRDLRVRERLGNRAHLRALQILSVEAIKPMGSGIFSEPITEDLLEPGAVLDLQREVRKAWIVTGSVGSSSPVAMSRRKTVVTIKDPCANDAPADAATSTSPDASITTVPSTAPGPALVSHTMP
jgi:hypothetical protein